MPRRSGCRDDQRGGEEKGKRCQPPNLGPALLAASRSWPGRFLPQPEQIGRPLARGSISSPKTAAPLRFDQPLLFVDEGVERLDAIEKTLEVHPAVAPGEGLSQQPHLYRMTPQDASFSQCLTRRAVLPGGEPPSHAGVCTAGRNPRSGRSHGKATHPGGCRSIRTETELTVAISPEGLSSRPWKDGSKASFSPTDSAEKPIFYTISPDRCARQRLAVVVHRMLTRWLTFDASGIAVVHFIIYEQGCHLAVDDTHETTNIRLKRPFHHAGRSEPEAVRGKKPSS